MLKHTNIGLGWTVSCVRNACTHWHVTILGNCMYVHTNMWLHPESSCMWPYLYIPTYDHTKKLHVPVHVCTHTEGEHTQKEHVFEHVWICPHVTMLWNSMCVNMWVHANIWSFLEIKCDNVCICQNMIILENCIHVEMHTYTHTQTHWHVTTLGKCMRVNTCINADIWQCSKLLCVWICTWMMTWQHTETSCNGYECT